MRWNAIVAVALAAELGQPRLERLALADLVDQPGGERRLGHVAAGRRDRARHVA